MTKTLDLTAIILAGGFGTRMKEGDHTIPKPLLKLGKYNLVEYNILSLIKSGVFNYIFSIGYLGNKIKNYFGDGSRYDINIRYIEDPEPLGDIGAFRNCLKYIEGTSLLVNSDDIRTGLSLEELLEFHKAKDAISTVAIIEQEDVWNHGILELNEDNRITRFIMNPSRDETRSNYANSGLYIMEKEILNYIPEGKSIAQRILHNFVDSQRFYGFPFKGLYFNVGTPEILESARHYLKELEQI